MYIYILACFYVSLANSVLLQINSGSHMLPLITVLACTVIIS